MLKHLMLDLLDRHDYSDIAVVVGVGLLGAAVLVGVGSPGTRRWRVWAAGGLGALLGIVAGALLVAGLSLLANLVLMGTHGPNHALHLHLTLVSEAAQFGGALGGGGCALWAALRERAAARDLPDPDGSTAPAPQGR